MASGRKGQIDEYDDVFYEAGEESVLLIDEKSTLTETEINITEDITRKFNVSEHSTPEYAYQKKMEFFCRFINNSVEYKNTGLEQVPKS